MTHERDCRASLHYARNDEITHYLKELLDTIPEKKVKEINK